VLLVIKKSANNVSPELYNRLGDVTTHTSSATRTMCP